MNIESLKEILRTFAHLHPFQTEGEKVDFLAKIDSLDSTETPDEDKAK